MITSPSKFCAETISESQINLFFFSVSNAPWETIISHNYGRIYTSIKFSVTRLWEESNIMYSNVVIIQRQGSLSLSLVTSCQQHQAQIQLVYILFIYTKIYHNKSHIFWFWRHFKIINILFPLLLLCKMGYSVQHHKSFSQEFCRLYLETAFHGFTPPVRQGLIKCINYRSKCDLYVPFCFILLCPAGISGSYRSATKIFTFVIFCVQDI